MNYWDNETIEKIRRGYFSAVYFNRTKHILEQEKNFKSVTMQVFQKNEGSILCGADEVVELLRVGTGYWDPPSSRLDRDYGEARWVSKLDELEVKSLKDGDKLKSWETAMHITGPYVYFAHLESLYLGILARRTLVATNVREVVEAAEKRQIIFFADRFDHFLNQEGDGYAAHIGGAAAICTEAMGKCWGGNPVGTIPHALIAINNGDTVASARQFMKYYPDVNLIALVDFDNDCVKTSLEVARALKDKLWGVRLDTAENIIDKSLRDPAARANFAEVGMSFFRTSQTRSTSSAPRIRGARGRGRAQKDNTSPQNFSYFQGVNPVLVRNVRNALDKEGFKKVKIIVSGGFNEEKIKWFEKEKVPVDAYGVGSSLVKGGNDFTADVVMVEGEPISKAGREYKPNNRLQLVKLKRR